MLEAIITSKARIELLKVFLLDPDGNFYMRELVLKTGLSQGGVQTELANLTKAGILERSVRGRQTYYRVNKRCPIVPELRSIYIKTVGIADVVRSALMPESDSIRCAFIFGSYARGDVLPESDIDLFVIGDTTLKRLTTALKSAQVAREINPVAMPVDEYRSRAQNGDHFVTSVLDSPKVFLFGDDDELRRLAK